MTTKHKPATPLPYTTESMRAPNGGTYYRIGREGDSGPVVQIFGTRAGDYDSKRQADYIVHACNNYPRLVEALRGTIEELTHHDLGGLGDQCMADARALLRDLGESE